MERRAGLVGPTTQAVVFHMTPILGALIGIVATLIIVAVAIVFIVRTRERDEGTPNGSANKLSVNTAQSKSTSQLNAESGSITASSSSQLTNNKRDSVGNALLQQKHDDEHNPDVVPNKNGKNSNSNDTKTKFFILWAD